MRQLYHLCPRYVPRALWYFVPEDNEVETHWQNSFCMKLKEVSGVLKWIPLIIQNLDQFSYLNKPMVIWGSLFLRHPKKYHVLHI